MLRRLRLHVPTHPCLVLTAGLAACAASRPTTPPATSAGGASAAGGAAAEDAAAAAPPAEPTRARAPTPPPGPLLAGERYPFRVRIDFREVRGNPLEPELRRFLGLLPAWARFRDATGLDPIAEIDRIAVGSPGERSPDWLLFAQTVADVERLRDALARYAAGLGGELVWSRRGGREVARLAAESGAPREALVLGRGWLTVGPVEATERVEALLDAGRDELVEGQPMPWAPDAPLVADDPRVGLLAEGRPSAAFGDDGRGPHTPERFRIAGRIGEAGGVDLRWTGAFSSAEEAKAARIYWDERRAEMARSPLVGMLGISEPFRDAVWESRGDELTFSLSLTLRQASLLLRFLAPMLSGTGGDVPVSRAP